MQESIAGPSANMSTSGGCASRPQQYDHFVQCDLLPSVMAPDRADRSFFCSARISPNPVNKSCPLLHRAQDWVIRLTVDDRLMFLFILLHFEHHFHAICQLQVVQWRRNKTLILEKSDIAKLKKLRTFHFPPGYLQVLAQPTGKESCANSELRDCPIEF
jgi:hypothetical protein